jgi:hypothetical protein
MPYNIYIGGPVRLRPTHSHKLVTQMTIEAYELELYATNVKCWIHPVIKTLSKKWREDHDSFSLDRAIAYIDRYCLTPAAKQYKLEHGSMTDSWHTMFPKPVRLKAAESIARHWIGEFKIGNFWD